MSKRCSEPSSRKVSVGWIWKLMATPAALCPSVFETLSKPECDCIAERQQMHVGMHMRSREYRTHVMADKGRLSR